MKIIHARNPRQEAIDALAKIFKEYKNVPVLFLSSGGSALSLLEPEILPEDLRLTVSVLDEHYVADPNERNFERLKRTEFFKAYTQPPSPKTETPPLVRGIQAPHPASPLKSGKDEKFLDPYGGEVEEAGKRFDAFLKNWIAKHSTGKIVCTAGMGADGHTAGIVPFSDAEMFENLFHNPQALSVGYTTDNKPFPQRVTATYSLLKQASDVILYAVGAEKTEAIRTLLASQERPTNEFPALFLKTLPQTTFFTDLF